MPHAPVDHAAAAGSRRQPGPQTAHPARRTFYRVRQGLWQLVSPGPAPRERSRR
ncbi:hypothetical protein LG634_21985 [Streptomyces bambusae]|uniref:hypothetical protein n=1 Tax=Streptomyces bambusae TaxID=1550616 RepID=UPI001CFD6BAE|nr:hypothetical protein [Streptomyces bambusae]MCB5167486.1 hypothetical protein [Streptomyces bambusae]